jgi:hypothetical protein
MSSIDRDYSLESPFPGSEKPSCREGFTLSIPPLKRQIETQYSSQNESLIV